MDDVPNDEKGEEQIAAGIEVPPEGSQLSFNGADELAPILQDGIVTGLGNLMSSMRHITELPDEPNKKGMDGVTDLEQLIESIGKDVKLAKALKMDVSVLRDSHNENDLDRLAGWCDESTIEHSPPSDLHSLPDGIRGPIHWVLKQLKDHREGIGMIARSVKPWEEVLVAASKHDQDAVEKENISPEKPSQTADGGGTDFASKEDGTAVGADAPGEPPKKFEHHFAFPDTPQIFGAVALSWMVRTEGVLKERSTQFKELEDNTQILRDRFDRFCLEMAKYFKRPQRASPGDTGMLTLFSDGFTGVGGFGRPGTLGMRASQGRHGTQMRHGTRQGTNIMSRRGSRNPSMNEPGKMGRKDSVASVAGSRPQSALRRGNSQASLVSASRPGSAGSERSSQGRISQGKAFGPADSTKPAVGPSDSEKDAPVKKPGSTKSRRLKRSDSLLSNASQQPEGGRPRSDSISSEQSEAPMVPPKMKQSDSICSHSVESPLRRGSAKGSIGMAGRRDSRSETQQSNAHEGAGKLRSDSITSFGGGFNAFGAFGGGGPAVPGAQPQQAVQSSQPLSAVTRGEFSEVQRNVTATEETLEGMREEMKRIASQVQQRIDHIESSTAEHFTQMREYASKASEAAAEGLEATKRATALAQSHLDDAIKRGDLMLRDDDDDDSSRSSGAGSDADEGPTFGFGAKFGDSSPANPGSGTSSLTRGALKKLGTKGSLMTERSHNSHNSKDDDNCSSRSFGSMASKRSSVDRRSGLGKRRSASKMGTQRLSGNNLASLRIGGIAEKGFGQELNQGPLTQKQRRERAMENMQVVQALQSLSAMQDRVKSLEIKMNGMAPDVAAVRRMLAQMRRSSVDSQAAAASARGKEKASSAPSMVNANFSPPSARPALRDTKPMTLRAKMEMQRREAESAYSSVASEAVDSCPTPPGGGHFGMMVRAARTNSPEPDSAPANTADPFKAFASTTTSGAAEKRKRPMSGFRGLKPLVGESSAAASELMQLV